MTTTLITGGNAGLGYETARRLKEVGQTVIIGSRNLEKGRKAAKALGVALVQLDVTDSQSIEQAAQTVQTEFGKLDVLINNAGMPGALGSPREIDVAAMQKVYDTNVFGIVRVTKAFLPLLDRSNNPVILNVSSGLGSFGQVLNPEKIESKVNALAYSSSKAAVSMLTVQYAKGLPNYRVNAVDPGPTKTTAFKNGGQTVAQGTDAVVKLAQIDQNGPTATFFNRDGVIPW